MANRFGARPAFWWTLGGAGLLYLWLTREQEGEQAIIEKESKKLPPEDFTLALPDYAKQYAEVIQQVAKEENLSPYLLAAIMNNETRYGTSRSCSVQGPACLGDAGHGHGLMQIDDRSHQEFLSKVDENGTPLWSIPYHNIKYGAGVFKKARSYFASRPRTPTVVVKSSDRILTPGTYADPRPLEGDFLLAAALAAYNAGTIRPLQAIASGADPDVVTYSKRYSADAIAHMSTLIQKAAGVV